MAKKKIDFKRIGTRFAGGATGGAVSVATEKILPDMNPYVKAAIKGAVGSILPELAPKSDFLDYAGAGLIGCAVDQAGTKMLAPKVEGVGDVGDSDEDYVVDVDDNVSGAEDEGLGGSEEGLGSTEDEEIYD